MELRDPEGKVQVIKDMFCSDAQIIQNIDISVKPNKECRICFQNE